MNLVLDAVEAGHHQGAEGEVRIRGRIREAHFDAARLRITDVRNPNRGRTVACRVGQHDRRFEARYQALVTVGCCVGEGVDRARMLDHTADVVQRRVGQAAVAVSGKQVDAILDQRHMNVHAVAVIADQRLGHEGRGLAVAVRDVVHAVLEDLHFVSLAHQGVEGNTDFALTGGCHFVVMDFDLEAHFFHRQAHRRANVVQRIDRRHREVTALDAGTVTDVAIFIYLDRAPRGFLGIDLVRAMTHFSRPLDVVEDEKFVLGAEVGGVGDAGGLQVSLGAQRDRARVAFVTFAGGRLDDVTGDVDRGLVGKRIERRGFRVGHQDHVGFVDPFPAGDRGAVEHLALGKGFLFELAGRDRDVLLLSLGIGKAKIDEFNAVLVNFVQHIRSRHDLFSRIGGSKNRGDCTD